MHAYEFCGLCRDLTNSGDSKAPISSLFKAAIQVNYSQGLLINFTKGGPEFYTMAHEDFYGYFKYDLWVWCANEDQGLYLLIQSTDHDSKWLSSLPACEVELF